MTKEELKNKIVEVVNQWHMFQNRDMNGHTIWLTNDSEKLADALIAAGIGDVETLRKIGAHATAMAVLRTAKAEHRAKVAERALQKCAENITCEDCPFSSDCASSEKMEDLIHSNYCFAEYLKQAEKELAEAGKNYD